MIEVSIEVTVDDMLDYGKDYEYFVDVLRDRLELNEEDESRAMITDYYAKSIPRSNVIEFNVTYELEED